MHLGGVDQSPRSSYPPGDTPCATAKPRRGRGSRWTCAGVRRLEPVKAIRSRLGRVPVRLAPAASPAARVVARAEGNRGFSAASKPSQTSGSEGVLHNRINTDLRKARFDSGWHAPGWLARTPKFKACPGVLWREHQRSSLPLRQRTCEGQADANAGLQSSFRARAIKRAPDRIRLLGRNAWA